MNATEYGADDVKFFEELHKGVDQACKEHLKAVENEVIKSGDMSQLEKFNKSLTSCLRWRVTLQKSWRHSSGFLLVGAFICIHQTLIFQVTCFGVESLITLKYYWSVSHFKMSVLDMRTHLTATITSREYTMWLKVPGGNRVPSLKGNGYLYFDNLDSKVIIDPYISGKLCCVTLRFHYKDYKGKEHQGAATVRTSSSLIKYLVVTWEYKLSISADNSFFGCDCCFEKEIAS